MKKGNSDEIKKFHREFYAKYFGNLSTIVFTILVIGNFVTLIHGSDDYETDSITFGAGAFLTLLLIFAANKFIK
ncbi:hypothetical protein Barb7_01729 [Bacteroidales bacterium Barb7]|nr:hypothetical protein Barb7_01729 [Bacteroidales bacterium Barb7]